MKLFFRAITICLLAISPVIGSSPKDIGTFEDVKEMGKLPTIRLLLKKQIDGSLVEVKGPYEVFDIKTHKKLSSGLKGKRFYLYSYKDGIKWGENFLGIHQITIVPTSPETSILVDGIQYKGAIDVFHLEGKISIINEVEIENYLKSTLSSKLPKNSNSIVLDALTISARTDAYYQVFHNTKAYWHLDASQVNYTGHGATLFNPDVDRSIETTRFLVMTYEGHPFATTWNQNCAGRTASYQSIFRKNMTSPAGVRAPFAEAARKEHHWSYIVDKNSLAKIAKTNRITGLDLFVDSSSEKVYAIRVQDGSHFKEIDFFTLQQGLGVQNLLSNDFTITIQGDTVIFDGYGEGCGVGLCLYSAAQMAKRGDAAPEILASFYPYSRIEQMKVLPEKNLQKSSKKVRKEKDKSFKETFKTDKKK